MRKATVAIVFAILSVLTVVTGCTDETPENVVTTNELKKRRAELAAKRQVKQEKEAQAEQQQVAAAQGQSNLEGDGFADVSEEYFYDPRCKRDPFRSFLLMVKEGEEKENVGPLADYELGQLDVVAIVWDAKSPRALVVDPRGRTHILAQGSPVGKNRGRVIHIGDNLVLVKETYVDFAGNESTNDVELRIRSSQGG